MIDPALESVDMKVRPKARGMKYTHYAPKGKLTIVEGEREKVAAKIAELVACKQAEGYKTAVLVVITGKRPPMRQESVRKL